MTTYSVDVEIGVKERTFDAKRGFDARGRVDLGGKVGEGGKLTAPASRTQRSGSYGGDSSFREPPRDSTRAARRIDGSGNYGNPRRTHVDVKATEVPGSKHQTLGNRARVAASNAKGALGKTAGMAGRLGGRVSPGVGINAKGDIDFGLRAGGAGVSLSVKGDISLGVPGLSATVSPRNGDTTVDIGFGGATIESTRVGCSITVTVKLAGKIINQDTRQADDCVEPEPTPTPTPTPGPGQTPAPTPQPPSPTPKPGEPKSGVNTTRKETKPGYQYKWKVDLRGAGLFSGSVTHLYCYEGSGFDEGSATINYNDELQFANEGDYIEEVFAYQYWDYVVLTPYYHTDNTITYAVGSFYGELMFMPGSMLTHTKSLTYKRKDGTWVHLIGRYDYVAAFSIDWGKWEKDKIDFFGSLTPGEIQLKERIINNCTWSSDVIISTNETPPYPPIEIPRPFGKPRSITPVDDDKCCELNKRIYEMLGGDDFYENGLTLPNSLYIPGGAGDTKAETYNGLINLLFRTLAYRTPGNIEVKLKDSNIMKPGQQPLTYKPTDATSYYNKLMEVSMSQDSDLSALLNLLVRLNWIAVQILNLTTKINYSTKALLGFFGVPTREKIENVDIPVDPSLGEAVGFENKKPNIDEIIKKLDKDDPKETRNILDKFMNATKIPVVIKSLVSTAQGGNYWWLLDKNKR